MLKVEGVSKRFRSGNYGARDVSLDLSSGVIGLLGPNGAGKTTLMQMIATITRPTGGRILFEGSDITKRPNDLRRKLGYLPQDFGVYDNLTRARVPDLLRRAQRRALEERASWRCSRAVNLHTVADRTLGGFSGGMKQRVGIAQALINDPVLVIVDEPTAGLDPEERVRFRNVLSEIGFGKLVILSTHIVSDIESIATQIAVMKEGRLLTVAAPEALLRAAEGHVWQSVVSSEQFDQLRTTLKISSAIRKPDGVHIRFVGPEPAIAASAMEPELEDAFLYMMNSRRAVA